MLTCHATGCNTRRSIPSEGYAHQMQASWHGQGAAHPRALIPCTVEFATARGARTAPRRRAQDMCSDPRVSHTILLHSLPQPQACRCMAARATARRRQQGRAALTARRRASGAPRARSRARTPSAWPLPCAARLAWAPPRVCAPRKPARAPARASGLGTGGGRGSGHSRPATRRPPGAPARRELRRGPWRARLIRRACLMSAQGSLVSCAEHDGHAARRGGVQCASCRAPVLGTPSASWRLIRESAPPPQSAFLARLGAGRADGRRASPRGTGYAGRAGAAPCARYPG
jgi:hypothetical protein